MFIGSKSLMGSRVSCVTDTLLIIDGHSMAFRAFYALPAQNFATSTGQHTNAVYGFTTMLVRLLEEEKPTHVAVAFDVSRHSFRTDIYPEYKGTRDATPEEFKGQVELIRQVLDTMGIVSLTKDGYEADDILATLAWNGGKAGKNVLVASGDRDSFQMVTDNVTVLYPGTGPGDLRRMTPAAIEEKYGVPPHRYPELAAIVGETSDNLPGVPGVGPKTAAGWIQKYDGLEGLLGRADEIKGKRGDALREHIDDIRRNRQLNHLLTDLELEVGIDDLHRGPTIRGSLEDLFDTLEFGASLRKRVLAVAVSGEGEAAGSGSSVALSSSNDEGGASTEDESAAPDITVATSAARVHEWLKSAEGPLSLWVEGIKAPAHGRVDLIAIGRPGSVLLSDRPGDLDGDTETALRELVESTGMVVGNWKGTWHALRSLGWDLPTPLFDVSLAAYIDRPDQRSYEAPDLVSRFLRIDLDDDSITSAAPGDDALFSLDTNSSDEPTREQIRAARICAALHPLKQRISADLEAAGTLSLLGDLEIPVSQVLATMEDRGIATDGEELRVQAASLAKDVEAAKAAAFAVIGHEVNLASPKQLQQVLFEELGLPKTKKTKTGWTTNAEALQDLLERTGNEFLVHLMAHRDRTKLAQMVETLRSCVDDDDRIRTTFSQVVAATGRLASADPNLQNIPARTPDGLRVRRIFIAGPGYESLMSADYSQIEMRIMAHLSEDSGLIEAFTTGEDLHRTMASMVFNVPMDEVTGEQRSRIKATSYGLAYGLSRFGLAAQLRIGVDEAAELMERYFQRFGGVRDYLAQVVEQARKDGWTATMAGRRRYLPDLNSDHRQRREMAERAALNAPIQGTAADIIKLAMIEVEKRLTDGGFTSRLLLQIHDELLIEVAPGERDAVEAVVREAMATPVSLSVPLDVAVGVGKNWMEAAH